MCGFEVVCAGKGTKHLAAYHEVTPATVWEHYGLPPEQTAGLNAQMFCSFLDGTKSAVEMAAVANATGLVPQARGLGFPPCGTADLAAQLRPAGEGGVLDRSATLEVVSSLHADGSPVAGDLRWGVYVTVGAGRPFRRGRVRRLWPGDLGRRPRGRALAAGASRGSRARRERRARGPRR